jgi:hypothetical protein
MEGQMTVFFETIHYYFYVSVRNYEVPVAVNTSEVSFTVPFTNHHFRIDGTEVKLHIFSTSPLDKVSGQFDAQTSAGH